MSAAHSAFPVANLGKLRAAPQHLRAIGRGAARWLQARSFAFTPEQVGIAEGLRAATAVALLVLAAVALHRPVIAWAAFAAFWTCLTDPGGSDGRRLRTMGAFVLVGTALAALMSLLAGQGPVFTAPILFAVVCLCGSSRILGPDMAQAGVLANVVAVVAADEPAAPQQALLLAGIFLGGGLLAIVLCLLVWRIHPYRPTRRTVAAVFRDLGEMTAELAQASASKAPGVPSALDAGRTRRLEGEHRWAVRGAI
ncbi:MAG: FUSC family membrane protein, partial [Caulobacteraceae bacterium]